MAKLYNLARMTTATVGTGTITLGSAVSGYLSFATAGAVNGDTLAYAISDGANSEIGYGTYTSSGTTLTRNVINSTNANAAISLSGTAQVFITESSHDFVPVQSVSPGGRLTLTSGTALTSSDVTGATTVYYTPGDNDVIPLWDGANWVPIQFTETSLSLSGLTASTNFDVWGRISAGVLALDSTAWTNDTTRATAIAQQNGVDVKSGDVTRRLLGTIRTIGTTGQTSDSIAFRFVSNRYNEQPRPMRVLEATASWSYQLSTLRQANGSTANQLDFVNCVARLGVAEAIGAMSNTTTNGTLRIGIGLDSTTTDSATSHSQAVNPATSGIFWGKANYAGYAPAGRHTLVWLEGASVNGGTMTQYGTPSATLQCGIVGLVQG